MHVHKVAEWHNASALCIAQATDDCDHQVRVSESLTRGDVHNPSNNRTACWKLKYHQLINPLTPTVAIWVQL